MKEIILKVRIYVPDDYVLRNVDELLEDAVNGELEHGVSRID